MKPLPVPIRVARVADAAGVVAALERARVEGVEARVRAGGHCFAGWSSTSGVQIDVASIDHVTVDGDRVRIGAGARLDAVIAGLAAHGRALPTGCGPDVGIAGLTLGGGLGVLGRRYGLTCDALVGATVVGAGGAVGPADADLLWGLRGGGAAGLAVVTELEFATVAAPPVATTFRLEWPAEHAAAVFASWQAWAPDAPRELAASLHVSAPADPSAPAYAEVSGAFAGPRADAETLLADLVAGAGAEPTGAHEAGAAGPAAGVPGAVRELAWADAKADLATLPAPHVADAASTRRSAFHAAPLDARTIAALVAHVVEDRRVGESRELDVSPWAGAYGDVPADATAFAWRDARVLLAHVVGTPPGAPVTAAAAAWADESFALTGAAPAIYPNFPEPGHADPAAAHFGANADRLRALKRERDPEGRLGDPFRLLG